MKSLLPATKLTVLVCVIGIGCGVLASCQPAREEPVTGLVSGTVTIDGQPLSAGVISLDMRRKAIGASATITSGQFTFDGPVSTGLYKARILPPEPVPPAPGEIAEVPAQSNIPDRYKSTETSDLEVRIDPGENKLEIDLKP